MILVTQSFFTSKPSSTVISGSSLSKRKRNDEEKIMLHKENPFRLLYLIQEKTDRPERFMKHYCQDCSFNFLGSLLGYRSMHVKI